MASDEVFELRTRVLNAFREQGFELHNDGLRLVNIGGGKEGLRRLHAHATAYMRERARPSLEAKESWLLGHIAAGANLDPRRIRPKLIMVHRKSKEELIFRYARLHWSIPVSSGYGRRLRFLVWDEYHDKLIGLFGLSDPVFALGPRDRWIGWDQTAKRRRLKNVMDAFILGAVPPYAQLLAGKLVALAVWSREVRAAFRERYGDRPSRILGEAAGELALVTTTSAFGRSSLYNRIRFQGQLVYRSVGFTQGTGDFPFLNGLYDELFDLVRRRSRPTAKRAEWGTGFRNRREVISKALKLLNLPSVFRVHGVRREVYVVPMGSNVRAFLKGECERLESYDYAFEDLAAYALHRWVWPRAERDPRYKAFEPESWRLWGSA